MADGMNRRSSAGPHAAGSLSRSIRTASGAASGVTSPQALAQRAALAEATPAARLRALAAHHRTDLKALSVMLGRNPAYIQQFITRGSPRKLDEADRAMLGRYFGVSGDVFAPGRGASDAPLSSSGVFQVPRFDIRASAGPGAFADADAVIGSVAFDVGWLRAMGAEPAMLSIIRAVGDSMGPTLTDGDDLLVDRGYATRRLRPGIYVLRMGDGLLVKRLCPGNAAGRIDVISDNPAYGTRHDVPMQQLALIGRVIWYGRRLD